MAKKSDHWAEMITRTEARITTLQAELLNADPPLTDVQAATIVDTIEAQVKLVEKFRDMQSRLKGKVK